MSMNMNPLGLNPQQSNQMLQGANYAATPESVDTPTPSESSQESPTREFLTTFRDVWKSLEDLNKKFGGTDDDFATLQKAAETWISNIVPKLPDNSNSQQQPANPNASAIPQSANAPVSGY